MKHPSINTDKKAPQNIHFTPEFLSNIFNILTKEKGKIQRELSSFQGVNPETANFNTKMPNFGDEEDDNVQEIEQFTVNKPLEVILENKLRDVDAAIERLEKGTYGICKYTDTPISTQRLLARPTSSSTIDAKKILSQEA